MDTISKKTYIIFAIVLIVLITAYLILNQNQSNESPVSMNNQTQTTGTTVTSDTSSGKYYSRPDDLTYLYQFDDNSHKLSRLNRSDLKSVGTPVDFFYVDDIGPTDTKGNTFILGAQTEQNISQNYLCDFVTACKPIDIDISQVILTPDGKTMVIKFQDEKYQLGYFETTTNKLSPVLTLDSPYYTVSFIDNDIVILYAGTGSTDPAPVSVLNLNSKSITQKIDDAVYFAASPSGAYIVYSKNENDTLNSYAYNTSTNTKTKLSGENFHAFFFDQNNKLYEVSTKTQGKIIYHNLNNGTDDTIDTKTFAVSNKNSITEIIWVHDTTYQMTFADGKTQQLEL